ncbi:hypothetical protein ACFY8K_28330 [Streptomyces misionensis]|uniref:hypothetical protein n=1 Tax=Streptomyces misionensis TaxID=67331 RepID=UPI00368DFEA2
MAVTMIAGVAVAGLLALAQTLVPEESEHKRDVLLAWMRHRERQARNGPPAQQHHTVRPRH